MVPSSGSFRPVPLGQEYAICILFCKETSGKCIEFVGNVEKKDILVVMRRQRKFFDQNYFLSIEWKVKVWRCWGDLEVW